MKAFTQLYTALDETTKTNQKIAALTDYFEHATPADAAWAIYFLTGRKPKQLVLTPKVVAWGIEYAGIPEWLFAECYDAVGDLAETIALLLPDKDQSTTESLTYWVEEKLLKLKQQPEVQQKELMLNAWQELDQSQRYIWNKLITGAFRVGVSQQLVIRALAMVSGIEASVIAHRMMGNWEPTAEFYAALIAPDTQESSISRPYPFYLAHPFEGELSTLGSIEEWQVEWKWDGIRSQLIRRAGQTFIWSRGEELITDRFPELVEMAASLPDGTAIDGEILPWKEANVMPFAMLQQRIGRKVVSKKLLQDVPVILMAYDLLEFQNEDIRSLPLSTRREMLSRLICGLPLQPRAGNRQNIEETGQLMLPIEAAVQKTKTFYEREESGDNDSTTGSNIFCEPDDDRLETKQVLATCQRIDTRFRLSTVVVEPAWEKLQETREQARELNVEGFMLKRLTSPYRVGRQRGDWWKWKVNPYTIDAVLIYAQRGSGKRASLYTDYTFGVWDGDALVPIAKAYSGLTDDEIRQVDSFVRQNTIDKFGPVRTVRPHLVFELGFEGIQRSSRHKSGVAVRFPRMLRWRTDKPASEADSLDTLKDLLPRMIDK
jgi:DNA ligase-1